ncbi:MAG: ABC transporter ATP-binding protein [Acidobacteria bacterium]|nr:ABC transporter ATP-binding protein [Acidobacteriota bacterium]
MALLEVRQLRKLFSGTRFSRTGQVIHAVDSVSFEVENGESLGVVGESGSGKTTLARCILRLLEPTSGEIFFESEDLLSLGGGELRRMRRKLQAVFQDPFSSLNPRMRAAQIVEEPLIIHRLGNPQQRRSRVEEMFHMVGLETEGLCRFPHAFSAGQRQRIALARALVCGPSMLIADEPLAALDLVSQESLLTLMERLKLEMKISFLFISHGVVSAARLCERIAVMWRGRLVEVAPARVLFTSPLHPYTRALLRAVPDLEGAKNLRAPEPPDRTLRLGELYEASPGHWVAA